MPGVFGTQSVNVRARRTRVLREKCGQDLLGGEGGFRNGGQGSVAPFPSWAGFDQTAMHWVKRASGKD